MLWSKPRTSVPSTFPSEGILQSPTWNISPPCWHQVYLSQTVFQPTSMNTPFMPRISTTNPPQYPPWSFNKDGYSLGIHQRHHQPWLKHNWIHFIKQLALARKSPDFQSFMTILDSNFPFQRIFPYERNCNLTRSSWHNQVNNSLSLLCVGGEHPIHLLVFLLHLFPQVTNKWLLLNANGNFSISQNF